MNTDKKIHIWWFSTIFLASIGPLSTYEALLVSLLLFAAVVVAILNPHKKKSTKLRNRMLKYNKFQVEIQ
jgi:hypothetical protein